MQDLLILLFSFQIDEMGIFLKKSFYMKINGEMQVLLVLREFGTINIWNVFKSVIKIKKIRCWKRHKTMYKNIQRRVDIAVNTRNIWMGTP